MEPGGISLVAGTPETDTVDAFLAQPLVVEIRDATGSRSPGITVRFAADVVTFRGVKQPAAYLSTTSPDDYKAEAEAVTDAAGRATARMRMGRVSGPVSITVSAPALGLAAYTGSVVAPGKPARVAASPRDTAVYVGRSYTLRVVQEDRWGNATSGAVTVATDAPSVASVAGATVSGQSIGRARVRVTVGDVPVPVHVSVVPRGTLAANYGSDAYMFDLDGAGYRRFSPFLDLSMRDLRWITGGGGVWLENGSVYVYTPSSGGRWLAHSFRGVGSRSPRASRDGQWVFFMGFRRYIYAIEYIAVRIRVDGTDYQVIGGDGMLVPSPSPTGDRVVYMVEDGYMRLWNIETRAGWGLPGGWPEWSHGDSIAYNHAGSIHLVSSAGQGKRQVGDGTRYSGSLDWSPDDEWIVAHDTEAGRLEIIRVATGERIPLPYARGMDSPSWRP